MSFVDIYITKDLSIYIHTYDLYRFSVNQSTERERKCDYMAEPLCNHFGKKSIYFSNGFISIVVATVMPFSQLKILLYFSTEWMAEILLVKQVKQILKRFE